MSRPFRPRPFHSREPLHRRNGKIRAREVRVLGEAKQQLGVMSINDALRLARSQGLDLVEVAPTANPSVCRIVEYGKFLYEEAKRKKDAHGRQGANRMKEIQISAAIDPHDLETKLNHAIQFLCDNMKVRVKLRFRGRQRAHKDIGFAVVNRFVQAITPYGQADSPPKMLGERDLHVVLSPLPRNKRAKNPHAVQTAEPPPAAGETPPIPVIESPPTGETAGVSQ